jgi:hypothetical protein
MYFPHFEQLISQQMVQFQDFISENVHLHTIFSMSSNGIFEGQRAIILKFYHIMALGWAFGL